VHRSRDAGPQRGSVSGVRPVTALVLAGVLGACRAVPTPATAEGESPPSGFPRTVVDSGGVAIRLAAAPRRIVSQTLATDEILFAIVDPVRIVGVSTLAVDPTYSNVVDAAKARGAPAIRSAEDVIALRPDLIFVASYSRAEIVELLRASGAPVCRFGAFDSIADVLENIRRTGRAVGADAEADRLVADVERRLAQLRDRPRPPGRPRVLSFTPSGQSAGAKTTFDDIVRHAGGINVAAERGFSGFPRLSVEQVLAWDPDVIVTGAGPGQAAGVKAALLANPGIAATRAARGGHIVILQDRTLLAASHHVVDAVDELARALDAFEAVK
jgi:iron complex transport system substrate-binding protein